MRAWTQDKDLDDKLKAQAAKVQPRNFYSLVQLFFSASGTSIL